MYKLIQCLAVFFVAVLAFSQVTDNTALHFFFSACLGMLAYCLENEGVAE